MNTLSMSSILEKFISNFSLILSLQVNKTVSGYECEYWNSTNGSIYHTLQKFHDLQDNYCRDDGSYYQPWCFTKSQDMR